MSSPEVKRKLTTILSADVQGYSRLMGEDEEATVHTLTEYRRVLSGLISGHQGRVVDSPGDNLLAEFGSVVDAVRCAVGIQREIGGRNRVVPLNRRMQFRIGINLGDVIVDGERIYGDGVNIAARLESLAEGGGICISGMVFDQIESKLPLECEYLGERTVKNIAKPVRVYRIQSEADAPAAVSPAPRAELFLEKGRTGGSADKPSIAVLPFVNMSGDPEQEYFSDGITEDLITDLSKISGLFVIARNSAFTYKGTPVKIGQVGRELGVRYVLEGSVRKAADRVRINAQLIDVTTSGHLWAERYDGDLQDIFALQDEVTRKIVSALSVKLTAAENGSIGAARPQSLEAYECRLRGCEYYSRANREANALAREMFHKAIDLDPEFAMAYVNLGLTYLHEWTNQWTDDSQNLDRAFNLAERAIALNPALPEAHGLLGQVYLWTKRPVEAIAAHEKALALDPNNADTCANLAGALSFSGKPEEGLRFIEKAMQLNPVYPAWYAFLVGSSHFLLGHHEEAHAALIRAVKLSADFWPSHMLLAALHSQQGRMKEARAEADEVLRITPSFTLERLPETIPLSDADQLGKILENLRKAGLP